MSNPRVKICDVFLTEAEAGMRLVRMKALALSGWVLVASAGTAAAQADEVPAWVRSDPAAQTVDLDFTVTRPAGAPSALINGAANGALQVVVPRGWTVRWAWLNADSSAQHSLVVMTEREKLPAEGGSAAFTNAVSRVLKAGLPPGGKDATTFVAEDGGWYWLLCGVPGHAIAGEYLGLRVDPEAKGASVRRVKGEE